MPCETPLRPQDPQTPPGPSGTPLTRDPPGTPPGPPRGPPGTLAENSGNFAPRGPPARGPPGAPRDPPGDPPGTPLGDPPDTRFGLGGTPPRPPRRGVGGVRGVRGPAGTEARPPDPGNRSPEGEGDLGARARGGGPLGPGDDGLEPVVAGGPRGRTPGLGEASGQQIWYSPWASP